MKEEKYKKERISGSEAVVRSLIAEEVNTIFGYPGGAIMPIFDALYDHKATIDHVLVRHEQGAIHAAQGFARVSHKVGVVMVTSGPGATNIVTGLTDAMMDSTPIVIISGQVHSHLLGTDAFQEADVISVTQPISKWAYQIRRAEDIPWAISRAFYIAKSGRPGPVVLDIAKDAQINTLEYTYEKTNFLRSYLPTPKPIIQNIEKASELINNAKKPFALIGQGVILGSAEKELESFLTKADIPFGWTILGLSAIPTEHRLNKGMLGMHGNIGPNMMTNECDVLIAIGMRFDDRVTGNLEKYAKQAKIIHFDIDAAEMNKIVKADVKVLGNVKHTLPLVTEKLKENKHSEWIASFNTYEKKEYDTVIKNELFPTEGCIKMGEVIHKVTEATENKAICVTDVGQNQMMATRYFRFTESRSLVTSGGLGTMGFGLPAGIGAKYGAPDRIVCIFVGDGGIQMTIQELGTIMEHNINVKIIILNNGFLGMVRQWQELFFDERYSETHMKNPDFIKIAEAYGIKGKRIEQREDLDATIQEMLLHNGSFIMEVIVETQGMVYPMIPTGGAVTDILLGAQK